MDRAGEKFAPTRRSVLTLAAGAGISGWVRSSGLN